MSTITFFTNSFYPYIGGVEKHILKLSNIAIKNKNKINIITINKEKKLPSYELFQDISIYRLECNINDKYSIWQSLIYNYNLFKNTDILHIHDVGFWILPFINFWKKYFITFHGYEGKYPISKKAIINRNIVNQLSMGSINVGHFIEAHYKTKPSYTIYGATDIDTYSNKSKKKNSKFKKLTYLGRLSKDMGIEEFISACKNFSEKDKINISFWGGGESKYIKMAQLIGNYNKPIMDISNIISISDVIFTSGYLGLLESYRLKIPTVSYYGNKLKKDYLVQSPFKKWTKICKSEDEILSSINYLLKNNNNKILTDAYTWSTNQTWDKIYNIYLSLWRKKCPWL